MRAFVLTDRSLARHAGRFVWLEINTEDARTAAFQRRYRVSVWPTFFVLDAAAERATLRWIGGLTLPQMHTLLDEFSRPAPASPALLAALMRADSLFGAAADSAAIPAYDAVLKAAPPDWPGYSRTIESQMYALSRTGGNERGVALAREALPRLGRSVSALNVASSGLECALALPDSDATRRAAEPQLEEETLSLVTDTSFVAAADDRSGGWISLLDAREAVQDSVGRLRVAGEWSAFLDGQAARAKTPEQRMVFDSHRLSAYLALGQPERAVPMLARSERDAPKDYNPPARLAIAFKEMQRWDEALAASDRAMALAYGPRKMLLFTTRADIFKGRGDRGSERRTIEDAIAFGEALPEGQRPTRSISRLRQRLAQLPVN